MMPSQQPETIAFSSSSSHPAGRVTGAYLQPLLEAAAARGISPQDLSMAAGLPRHSLRPLPESLAADHYVRLLDVGAALARDRHFGLHVGERVKPGTYSAYGLILLSCPDFGQAFEQSARYEQLAHDLGRSSIQIDGGQAHFVWHSNYAPGQRHLIDSVFAGMRVFCNWLAGAALPPAGIVLTHPGGGDDPEREYARVLGSQPRFGGAANVASFDARMLDWPMPNADVSLYPLLQRHAEQLLKQRVQADAALGDRVRAAIACNLARDRVRLGAIAEQLNVSPRTLQRKLSEAGTSFQLLLDQARFALAKDYLRQEGLSLTDIAFLLGFREQSAFTHAFKDWSGLNPGAYRSALAA
ncbi:MAG: AraC family transcriptional regulator [Pseudomonadota bacterium]